MDVNVIKFRRRLSDPRMIERMKDLLEDEMDDSDPCDYLENRSTTHYPCATRMRNSYPK